MDDGVWKGIRILLGAPVNLNKFFDPSTPSMRQGRNGEQTGGKMEKQKKKIKMFW